MIILSLTGRADKLALKYITDWVDGKWQPESVDINPIEWFIQWLSIREN